MNSNERPEDNINNSSNNTSMNHIMDLVKAALPYLGDDTQHSMGLIVKLGDLMETMTTLKQSPTSLTTLSIDIHSIDLEGLLTSVRNVCYEKEREIVDMILNFIKAKNLYETYTTLTQAMASQTSDSNDSGDSSGTNNSNNSFGNMFGSMFSGMSNNGQNPSNMNDMLEAFLTPEQISTYENLSLLLNTM